jgi:phage terminase large subunit
MSVTSDGKLELQIPGAFEYLIKDEKKYYVAMGGRGSAKSQSIARVLISLALGKPIDETPYVILCTRSLQKSIKESVHALIRSQIWELGVASLFTITETTIKCYNGVEFIFAGLKHNINDIKSMHGVKYCWIEEAQNVSEASLSILIPTIRVPGAKFFISFNVDFTTDAVYERYAQSTRSDVVCRKVNWQQNPFFPETLRVEMEHLRDTDYDEYLHVWEGHPILALKGAVYAKEIRDLYKRERITKVPHQPGYPVHTFWDLGYGDYTAIWFAQKVGFEYRVINFYENRLEGIPHYLQHLDRLRSKEGYVYGTHCLPHDGAHGQLAAGGQTIQMQVASFGECIVGEPRNTANSINSGRAFLANAFFDEQKCSVGLNHLQRYAFKVDPDTNQYSQKPIHDDNSHAADAMEEMSYKLHLLDNLGRVPPTLKLAMPPPDEPSMRTLDRDLFGGHLNGDKWMGS